MVALFTKTVAFLAAAFALIGVGHTAPSIMTSLMSPVLPPDEVSQTSNLCQRSKTSFMLTTTPTPTQRYPSMSQIICRPEMYNRATAVHIQTGISYLRGKGREMNHPNLFKALTHYGQCSRVSCSWKSAIYVCNDNPYDIEVPLGTVADYAQALSEHPECHYKEGANYYVWGQAFSKDGWSVCPHQPCFSLLFCLAVNTLSPYPGIPSLFLCPPTSLTLLLLITMA